MNKREYFMFSVAGRLKPGASLAQTQIEATRIAEERARTYPELYVSEKVAEPLPVLGLREETSSEVGDGLKILFAAVIVLLLVACANVTHLYLARGVTRLREMTVRRALGASTRSLLAQLLTESLLLGMLGSLAGVLIAMGGVQVFLTLLPEGLPRAGAVAVDARVWLFAASIGILTAVIFGLLPGLRFARGPLSDPLRASNRSATSGRGAQTFRNAIVVLEVALSLVLVAQSGWLLRSFLRMSNEELGFRTESVVTIPMSVPGIKDASEWYRRMEGVRESLAQTPGVKQAAFGLTMPLEWVGGNRCCWGQRPQFTGHEQLRESSAYHPVSDDFFSLLDVRVMAGATWTRARANAVPAPAVINEMLARKVFGSANAALGATFTTSKKQFEVIGVVANTHHYGADQDFIGTAYLPASAIPFSPTCGRCSRPAARSGATWSTSLSTSLTCSATSRLTTPSGRSTSRTRRRPRAARRWESPRCRRPSPSSSSALP